MLDGGDKLFFRIDSLPYDDNNGIYLTHLTNDGSAMKMTGLFPVLWNENNKITGPNLYDEDYTYRVAGVDYQNQYIWLERI